MKIQKAFLSESIEVTSDLAGCEMFKRGSTPVVFQPLPYCRVPTGFGRTLEQATAIADKILAALIESGADAEYEDACKARFDQLNVG